MYSLDLWIPGEIGKEIEDAIKVQWGSLLGLAVSNSVNMSTEYHLLMSTYIFKFSNGESKKAYNLNITIIY